MAKSKELNYKIKPGNPMILGAAKTNEGINFALMVNNGERKPCSLILYEKGTMKVVSEIAFSNEMWYGNICTMCLGGINLNDFDYNYRIGNRIVTDPYATLINGAKVFGDNDSSKKTSAVHVDRFKWEDDRKPMTDFCDSIIYRLHVRGFTMDRFSGVKKKGTFAGVAEKIPYFKELGITMVELMPAYEFNENFGMKSGKVNYWGYTTADYFMPKVAFSNKKDAKSAINEFKTLVKELHKNNIEICMEFFFEEGISPAYMIDCFRYWVINYHIDGIHCNMSDDIRGAVSSDPYLSNTKIISYGFDNPNYAYNKNLGEYNDVFMNVSRKFLKGDEGTVKDMAFRVRYNKDFATPINFIATNNTFTMMDMVSYSSKHNQDNGELNRDGREDNYSWNCGVEGMTKGKKTNEFRMKQLKNAFCMLMLSQGAPLIYAGDEFGNTANGNNNTGAWVAGAALVMGAAVCGLWGRGSLPAVGMAVGRAALSPGAAVAVTVPEKTADRGEGSGRMGGKGTSSRTSTRAQRKRKVRFGTARRAASRIRTTARISSAPEMLICTRFMLYSNFPMMAFSFSISAGGSFLRPSRAAKSLSAEPSNTLSMSLSVSARCTSSLGISGLHRKPGSRRSAAPFSMQRLRRV